MLKRKWFWACVLAPLYAVTWVGGWTTYARQLQERAESGYRAARQENEQEETEARLGHTKPFLIELREGGPTSHVYWCLPLAPGVLLMDSDYCVGPLYAGGGTSIVLYNGFSCTEAIRLLYWLA